MMQRLIICAVNWMSLQQSNCRCSGWALQHTWEKKRNLETNCTWNPSVKRSLGRYELMWND